MSKQREEPAHPNYEPSSTLFGVYRMRRDVERLHYSNANPVSPSEVEPIPGPGRDVLLVISDPEGNVAQIAIRLD
jgi:hypothetical protein